MLPCFRLKAYIVMVSAPAAVLSVRDSCCALPGSSTAKRLSGTDSSRQSSSGAQAASAAQTTTRIGAPARSFNVALLRRDHRDLDQHVGGRKLGLDAGTRRQVVRIDPGEPGLVHLFARADVGEPDLRRNDLGLVAARLREPRIDPAEDLFGLRLDRSRALVGDGASDIDHAIRFDGAGKDFCGLVADDAHMKFLMSCGGSNGVVR